MAAKYTLKSNTTAGDRIGILGGCALQLSTRDLVQMVFDPAAATPNQISLVLVTAASGHTVATTIDTISTNNWRQPGGAHQGMALCRDASDNLYLIGSNQAGGATNQIGVKAWVKQKGSLTWHGQQYLTAYYAGLGADTYNGFAASWCNTGGGPSKAGHVFVIANTAAGNNYAFVINAGTALAGNVNLGIIGSKLLGANPSYVGTGNAVHDGSNLDIAPDGFGAMSGLLAIGSDDATHMRVSSWGVTNQGVITTGVGMPSDRRVCGALSGTNTKLKILRYAAGSWAVVGPSSSNAGQFTIWTYSASGLVAQVDTGTPSNFPASSATTKWGAAQTNGTVWVYGWSSASGSTMLRLQVILTGGTPSIGTVVTDDTGVGSGTNSTTRVVKDPVDPSHVDWQTNNTTSPFSLLGDYSNIQPPPNVPTLTAPASGQVAQYNGGALTLSWLFTSPLSGDVPTAYYLRRQVSGGAQQWWTGSAWSNVETSVASAATSVTFPAGSWASATQYVYSVQVAGSTGLLSGYATDVPFTVSNPAPTAPTLTAVYDAVNNLTALTLHSADATGPTGSIESSDDGGTTWAFVRNASALVVNPGTSTLVDYEAPHGGRQYRARTWTVDPAGYSLYATAAIAISLAAYWLKDPIDGTSQVVRTKQGEWAETIREDLTEHIIPGRSTSLVIAGAVTGKQITTTFHTESKAESDALLALLSRQRVLLLQSPEPRQQYLRRTAAGAKDLAQRETRLTSHREFSVTFAEAVRP